MHQTSLQSLLKHLYSHIAPLGIAESSCLGYISH